MGGLTTGLLSVCSLLFVLSDLTSAAVVFRGKFDAVAAETDEEEDEFDC